MRDREKTERKRKREREREMFIFVVLCKLNEREISLSMFQVSNFSPIFNLHSLIHFTIFFTSSRLEREREKEEGMY